MNELGEFVKNIIIIAVALSFAEILLPASNMSRYVKFIFSLILLAAITRPVAEFLS